MEEYFVIEINEEFYRVIDDTGEPILYPKALFEILDPAIPPGWKFREYEDGEYFLDPLLTGGPGFYEKLFCSDGDRVAQAENIQTLREALEAAMAAGGEEDRRLIQRDLERLSRWEARSIAARHGPLER